jgi:hypothetical protein
MPRRPSLLRHSEPGSFSPKVREREPPAEPLLGAHRDCVGLGRRLKLPERIYEWTRRADHPHSSIRKKSAGGRETNKPNVVNAQNRH